METPDQGNTRPRNGNGTYIRSIETAERDAQAVRLRVEGKTLDEIAVALGYANRSGAFKAIERAFTAAPAAEVAELRALENARLDRALSEVAEVLNATHYRVSNSGKVVAHPTTGELLTDPAPKISAVNALVKIGAARRALNGLDAPKAIRIEQPEVTLEAIDAVIARLRAEYEAEQLAGPPPGHPG